MIPLSEFISDNIILVIAFAVVTIMIIRMELFRRFSKVTTVGAQGATKLINDGAIVVDVREPKEYKDGHLRDAIHIPLGSLASQLTQLEQHKDKDIVVYCRSGNRSSHACRVLEKNGYEKLYNLGGGIGAWMGANLPVTKK